MIDVNYNLDATEDPVSLRAAFDTLVSHRDALADPISGNQRKAVLQAICNKLGGDTAVMLDETCAALELPPGIAYAAGAETVVAMLRAKEADRG